MSARSKAFSIARIAASAIVIAGGTAQAADIEVMAANAVKGAIVDLVAAFERSSGHTVAITWGGTEGIGRRIDGGEIVDVVIVAAPVIDRLTARGRLVAGSRKDIAKSGVGVAVRAGLPKPDISSAEAVRKAVLESASVAYSSGPSGAIVAALFRQMGIDEQIRGKLRQTPTGVPVGDLLARGEADLGFQQVSELLHVKGIDYLGPLPAEIQSITVYAAGLHEAAPAPEAAAALVRFLTAPEAGATIRKAGMEPG